MKKLERSVQSEAQDLILVPHSQAPLCMPEVLGQEASNILERMFRDPRVLEPQERKDLVSQLRDAVELAPQAVDIRVMLGMALCVDMQPQEAMEQLREAVNIAPDSFIARLKFGELLMRLRICDQAAEHTHEAARLASNTVQSEMARRQATTIRTMGREGIERGGYARLLPRILPFRNKATASGSATALIASK
jgi:hypothetical protein